MKDSIVIKFFIIIISVFFCLLTIELFRLGLQNIEKNNSLLMAAFTFLSFLGVIFTIIVQNKNSKIQRFEDTFFNMLKNQENIVSYLKVNSHNDGEEYRGREYFYCIYEHCMKDKDGGYFGITLKDELRTVKNIQGIKAKYDMFSDNLHDLDSYFCYLYRIIKFVDGKEFLTKEEKSNYIDILRAGLSSYEVLILFYNGLSQEDKKMKKFIEHYALLDHLRDNLLANIEHMELYNISAYGNNEYLQRLYNSFPIVKEILLNNLSNTDCTVYINYSNMNSFADYNVHLIVDLKQELEVNRKKILSNLEKSLKEKVNNIAIKISDYKNAEFNEEDIIELNYKTNKSL